MRPVAPRLLGLALVTLLGACHDKPRPASPPPRLELLASGDNRGEVEPCGCHLDPTGGLAKRATAIAAARKDGARLLVDSGDAFYAGVELPSPAERGRAHLLVDEMGKLGYDAMAVGERDLAGGLDDLRARAKAAKLPLLAANLVDAKGAHPFERTRVIATSLGPIGIFAVTRLPQPLAGLQSEDPAPSARAAIQTLHAEKVVAIVALLHLSGEEATTLVRAVPGIDLGLVAHEGRVGTVSDAPPVYALGKLGKGLVHVDLDLGPGPVADALSLTDLRNELKILDGSLQRVQGRLKTAQNDLARKSATAQIELLTARRAQLQALADRPRTGRAAGARTENLDQTHVGDPVVQAAVDAEVARDGHTPGH